MTIDQTTQTGIVNWKSFSLGKANSIVFDNDGGATLNIVKGNGLSRISGSLQSNGSVYLVNRAGVVVSGSGRIDTQGAFGTTTRGVDSSSFRAARRILFAGGGKGKIVERGLIRAGDVLLVAGGRLNVTGGVAARRRIETSSNGIALSGARISGRNWLIDPKNLKVGSGAAATISSSLNGGTNVTLKTTATSASGPGSVSGGKGDITIAAPIAWSGTARLILDAYHGDIVDQLIHVKGKGHLVIKTNDGGAGGDLTFGKNGQVTFDNLGATLNIDGAAYMLADNLSSLAAEIAAHPARHFALTQNLDLKGHTYRHAPVSPSTTNALTGVFEGLGHTISNFTIRDLTGDYVGLFGVVGNGGTLRDIGLLNPDVTGLKFGEYAGALVGLGDGPIVNAFVSGGRVLGGSNGFYGGLAGGIDANGGIFNSHAGDAVTSGDSSVEIGGLTGFMNNGTISNSFATGNVTGGEGVYIGGLVGFASNTTIMNAHASGRVRADDDSSIGGLVGDDAGANIKSSYATGEIFGGYKSTAGGLVGVAEQTGNVISGSHASGHVIADQGYEGGLIGWVFGTATIKSSYATGDVDGQDASFTGGLVGFLSSVSTILNSRASGAVSAGGGSSHVGGLVGENDGAIKSSHASGEIDVGAESDAGGLVGLNSAGTVSNSYATGAVNGGRLTESGGLVGTISGGIVSGSHATGAVYNGYTGNAGGLFGELINAGSVKKSHATGNVTTAGNSNAGGLGGVNTDGTISLSYATGDVYGSYGSSEGGMIGSSNGGTIAQSFSTGTVTGDDGYLGGFAGQNGGVIANSYALSDVIGVEGSFVGGFVGQNTASGRISKSYSAGHLTDDTPADIGGFISNNLNTTSADLVDDYWDAITASKSPIPGIAFGTGSAGVVSETTSQLKGGLPSGFTGTIWAETSGTNGGLPFLRKNSPP